MKSLVFIALIRTFRPVKLEVMWLDSHAANDRLAEKKRFPELVPSTMD